MILKADLEFPVREGLKKLRELKVQTKTNNKGNNKGKKASISSSMLPPMLTTQRLAK